MAHSSNQEFKRYRAMKGADAASMSPTRFAPYRAILDDGVEADWPHAPVEVLECGHRMRPRHDMIGRTYPSKRRCVDCLRAACEEAGHPLVDWNKNDVGIGRPLMRCKCTARDGTTSAVASHQGS